MSDPNEPGGSGRPGLDPAEAFSLLGNATRLAIVTTLHERGGPVPFSELYDDLDLDDTGQFNYHLDKLVPHFVAKDEDGYELSAAGERIARAVAAGRYTDSPRLESFEVEGRCYACDEAALWGAYEDERFEVECRSCGEPVLSVDAPPSLVRGRDPSGFVDAFHRWSWRQVETAVEGICPDCGGAVETGVIEDTSDRIAFDAVALIECTVCGRSVVTSFGGVAAQAPDVKRFHRERGRPLGERPYWDVEQFVTGEHDEIVSRDPWRVRVTFHADGDACRADVDGDLSVVDVTVVSGDAADGPDDA